MSEFDSASNPALILVASNSSRQMNFTSLAMQGAESPSNSTPPQDQHLPHHHPNQNSLPPDQSNRLAVPSQLALDVDSRNSNPTIIVDSDSIMLTKSVDSPSPNPIPTSNPLTPSLPAANYPPVPSSLASPKSKTSKNPKKKKSKSNVADHLGGSNSNQLQQQMKPSSRSNKVADSDSAVAAAARLNGLKAWKTGSSETAGGNKSSENEPQDDGTASIISPHHGKPAVTRQLSTRQDDEDDQKVLAEVDHNELKKLFRPDSKFLTYWSYCLLFFAGYNALTISYRWAFWIHHIPMDAETVIQIVIDALSDLFFWYDIYISLNTAISDNGQLITDKKLIRQSYYKSWFALDVITCIPFDLIQLGPDQMLPWTRGFKILRIFHILHHIQRIEENTSVSFKFRLAKLVFYTFFISHFVSCVKFHLFLIPSDPHFEHVEHMTPFSAYLQSLGWAMGSITGRDNTQPPETYEDCVFTVIMMLVGVLWLAYIIASLEQFSASSTSNSRFQEKLKHVAAFMHAFKIPQNIQLRVKNYYSYLWSSSERFESEEFVKKLPAALQTDLRLAFYRPILEKAEIFRNVESGFLSFVVHHLHPVVAIPREVIFEREQEGENMYFIQDGEIEVLITAKMTNIATLRVGDYFGEYSLFTAENRKRTATTRSVSYSTLLRLSHNDLMKAMSLYPQTDKRIRAQIQEHRSRTLQQEQNLLGLEKGGNANSKLKKLINVDDNEAKQARHHPYTVDPKSKFYRAWQFVSVCYSLYNLISLPIRFGFEPHTSNGGMLFIDYSGDFFFICDIIVNFRLRYIEKGSDISDPALIRHKYLRSWFALHVVASLPLDFFMLATGMQPLYRLNRNLRMIYVHTIVLQKLKDTSRFEVTSLIYLIANFLFLSHWASCIYYAFTRFEGFDDDWLGWRPKASIEMDSVLYQYFWSQYYALALLSGIGRHNFPPSDIDVILSVVIMMIGCFVVSYLIGKMGHLMLSLNAKAHDFKREYQFVQQLLEYKKVDGEVSSRVNDYLKHSWQSQKGIDPNVALADLPLQLRTDIMMFICEDMIRAVPRFQGLDESFIRQLVSELTFIELPVNEWIFRQGQIGTEMYFISSGLVEILLEFNSAQGAQSMAHSKSSYNLLNDATQENGLTMYKLKTIGAGSFFGEGALFCGVRSASIKTNTPCQLLCLSESSFKKIMQMHPRFARKITKLNKDRQERLWAVMQELTDSKEEQQPLTVRHRFSIASAGGHLAEHSRHSRMPSFAAPPKLPAPVMSDNNSVFLPSTISGFNYPNMAERAASPVQIPGSPFFDGGDGHSDSESMESVDRTHQAVDPSRNQLPEYQFVRRKSTVTSMIRASTEFSSNPRPGLINADSLPMNSMSLSNFPPMQVENSVPAEVTIAIDVDTNAAGTANGAHHPRTPSMALFGRSTSLDPIISEIENRALNATRAADETRRTPPLPEGNEETREEKSSPSEGN